MMQTYKQVSGILRPLNFSSHPGDRLVGTPAVSIVAQPKYQSHWYWYKETAKKIQMAVLNPSPG